MPLITGQANLTAEELIGIVAGYSGFSGYSGSSGYSGYSGPSGFSGYSGSSGFSGYSGPSGFSGYSGPSGFSGYSGISGFSGYSGQSGFSGYSGHSGIYGGDSFTYALNLTGTSDADPGSGTLGFNSGTISTITQFYADNNDYNSVDITAWLDALDDSNSIPHGRLRMTLVSNPTTFADFNITGSVVDGTGYRKIGVTYVAGNGTFTDLLTVILSFSSSGNSGFSGYSGRSGYSGYSGALGTVGTSGFSGYSGPSGFSGYSGPSGFSGYSGQSGYSGYSGGLSDLGITFIIDGGGAVITTGLKGYLEIPFACTITGWTILSDVSGAVVVDVWKDTYANALPTVIDTITGSEKPTIIASGIKGQDLTLSTWTGTTVTKGDILAFSVDSVATCTKVSLTLRVTRT